MRVRELTVEEIRAWLHDLSIAQAAEEVDLADYLLFEADGIRINDFCRMTDLMPADIERMTPSALEGLLAQCREVNPRFFTMLGRVLAMGKMSIQQRSLPTSNTSAPTSQNWFTRMFGRGRGAG